MGSVNEKIFRAYDIRGIYPGELDEEMARQIGRAFAVYLRETEAEEPEKIIVGHDVRLSSPILSSSFIQGITLEGIDVLDIGEVTVDMVYFASSYFHWPAAMVTASHNPKEYNGFKLMKKNTELIGNDSGLRDIRMITEKNWPEHTEDFGAYAQTNRGKTVAQSIFEEYRRHVLSFIDVEAIGPIKVAIDTGSGAAGPILKMILEKLPIDYKPLNFEPDGNFISHEPDPTKEKNLEELKTEIKTGHHYNFGCAFDGDGDRIVFVDENGNLVSSSIIGAIMARHFLKAYPRGKIVYGSAVSRIIPEAVNIYGGEAIRERIGHTFISKRLKEVDGVFGMETSSHYYFRKNFYADSGIISFLVMLYILSCTNKRLSGLAAEFSKYVSIPEINFSTKGGSASGGKVFDTEEFLKKIAQNFEGYDMDWFDGLTVRTEDFWLNIRSSNTEPLVRLNIEAKDELILERTKKDIVTLIGRYK